MLWKLCDPSSWWCRLPRLPPPRLWIVNHFEKIALKKQHLQALALFQWHAKLPPPCSDRYLARLLSQNKDRTSNIVVTAQTQLLRPPRIFKLWTDRTARAEMSASISESKHSAAFTVFLTFLSTRSGQAKPMLIGWENCKCFEILWIRESPWYGQTWIIVCRYK